MKNKTNDIVPFILLVLLYVITGKLGLLMAVPPGFSTAVWPPSGFAFAGLLIYGYRFWPCIWLGSFLVNMSNVTINVSSSAALFESIRTPIFIGLGASLQALAGAYLVRRFVGYPTGLIKEGEVFKFFLLSGPVSCFIGSTLGVTILFMQGVIKLASVPFSWWTWWIGDCIGVFIFAPIMMMFAAEPKDTWRKRKAGVMLPMLITFALMVVLFVFIKDLQNNQLRDEFNSKSELMVRTVENNVHRYLDILYSLRSFYEGSDNVERSEFTKFVSNSLIRHPNIIALEWDPKVTGEERESFEKSVQSEGFPQFHIKEMGPQNKIQKAGDRPVYFPITFAEPINDNLTVLGFDFMSEASRFSALDMAGKTGNLALTKPIKLIQGPMGVIAFLAVYFPNESSLSEPDKIKRLKGFVVEVLNVEGIISEALENFKERQFVIRIVDMVPMGQHEVLMTKNLSHNHPFPEDMEYIKRFAQGLHWVKTINIGERYWQIEVYPTSDYFSTKQNWNMWFVLAGGLLFVSFLGGFLIVISGREALVTRLVGERTQELNSANDQLKNVINAQEKLTNTLELRNKDLDDARLSALNIAQDAQEARASLEKMNEELTNLNSQLKKVDSLKSEFTSMVSHELRTPLTVIKESVSIVYDETAGPINADQKDFLETAKRNVDRLGRLINDVLDYQKLESQFMEFRMKVQSINQVVDEVGKGFKRVIENKGVRLEFQLDPHLPEISFDKDKITQVLTNLINNAMKFTNEGSITLITQREGSNAIRVSIKDQGIGIKEEDLDKLFKSFSQISTGSGRQTGGTGLGLALSKKIVEYHKGKMGVESAYGMGSIFYFILPIEDRRVDR